MVPIPRKGPETQWPEGTDGTPIVDMASILRLWDPYYVSDPGPLRMRSCAFEYSLTCIQLRPASRPAMLQPGGALQNSGNPAALGLLKDLPVVGLSELGLWTNMPRFYWGALTDY